MRVQHCLLPFGQLGQLGMEEMSIEPQCFAKSSRELCASAGPPQECHSDFVKACDADNRENGRP